MVKQEATGRFLSIWGRGKGKGRGKGSATGRGSLSKNDHSWWLVVPGWWGKSKEKSKRNYGYLGNYWVLAASFERALSQMFYFAVVWLSFKPNWCETLRGVVKNIARPKIADFSNTCLTFYWQFRRKMSNKPIYFWFSSNIDLIHIEVGDLNPKGWRWTLVKLAGCTGLEGGYWLWTRANTIKHTLGLKPIEYW